MYAIAGLRENVFGFFSDPSGSNAHWEFFFKVTDPLNDPQVITALFSQTGERIWIGTGSGRIFEFDSGVLTGFGVDGLKNPNGDADAAVFRIVAAGDVAFASYIKAGVAYILARTNNFFVKLSNGLPTNVGAYYGLELVAPREPVAPAMAFASTDESVYISRDLGKTWRPASQGLPTRPHCADLRFVQTPDGERALYLSTFGRSVWRASVADH